MVVKNIQIYGVQISGKWISKSNKIKLDISTTPRKNSLTGLYHHPQGRDKLLIHRPPPPPSKVKGED